VQEDATGSSGLVRRLERYYDTMPRAQADVEDHGPFTLFVSRMPWPLYARPRLGCRDGFGVADVAAVRRRQEELGLPVRFEWTHEAAPSLAEVATRAGLSVERYPLLVLDELAPAASPPGIRVRFLEADDAALALAVAAVDVAFSPRQGNDSTRDDTAQGDTAPDDTALRDELARNLPPGRLALIREHIRAGQQRWAVAEDESGPVAGGSYRPYGDAAELMGIATLRSRRQRGIGSAVTAALAADARRHGVVLVFLSAGSADAARIYERLGFRRVATACAAVPPSGPVQGDDSGSG
jgi:ribosomal protein S18 acetylase RimI-like enzyme